MTTEELLKPRVIVIADYPRCPHCVGDILPGGLSLAKTYPRLFRVLSWYESRSAEDMPHYVRHAETRRVYAISEIDSEMIKIEHTLPATFEEYEVYNQQKATP